ncbi:MAG: hypothetical protein IKE66_00175 [Hyphomicrobium sp.]|nr:hypothetical protein [Hyphomicrobium sp.]
MIAHVAEASEASGRVLLWLEPDQIAMPETAKAAVSIARAYAADIETLVLDAPSAGDATGVPVAHRSLLGKAARPSPAGDDFADQRDHLEARQLRDVHEIASGAGVRLSHARARGDAIDRLAELCLSRGPWNIIAVSRPPSPELPGLISSILANVSGATGVVVAGRTGAALSNDVAVILEDSDRMPSMLRAAERLLPPKGRIQIFIAADSAAQHDEIDGQARLLTAGNDRFVHYPASTSFGISGAFDCELFRLKPSFIIARFGGVLLGQSRALTRLLSLTPAPILLVR